MFQSIFWHVMTHKIQYVMIVLALILGACQSDAPPPTPTAQTVVIVRPLATVGPTSTPDEAQQRSTQLASRPSDTPVPPTPIPSATPYVGVFLGEADISQFNRSVSDPAQFVAVPTRDTFTVNCEIPIDVNVFGDDWQAESRALSGLRCPIQSSFGFVGGTQIFDNGAMYENSQTGELWAIVHGTFFSDGTLLNDGRFWSVTTVPPMSTEGIEPPSGRLVPQGDFGAMWVAIPQVREALGFALTGVQEVDINIQRFEGGLLLRDLTVGQTFVLLVSGDAFGPYN